MEDFGKSIPAAEGMVDAENAGKTNHNEFCLNCGTKLVDVFCHHCGQKDIPRRQTLGELWINFISSFWSYEGKFLTTTKYLITKPGFLALEYNAGRRESYYHPARMYVFISFVFFLLLVSLPDVKEEANLDEEESLDLDEAKSELAKAKLDSVLDLAITGDTSSWKSALSDSIKKASKNKKVNVSLTKSDFKTREAYDSAQLALPEPERDWWITKKFKYRTIELNQRYGKDNEKLFEDFKTAFMDNFSKILFFLLPVFALLLKLLYIRKDYFYSEHLVFSIYYYNFVYLAGSLQMLGAHIPWIGGFSFLIGWWIFFYLLLGMKRMYKQPWGKTSLKFFLFLGGFTFFVVVAIVINTFFIFMMI